MIGNGQSRIIAVGEEPPPLTPKPQAAGRQLPEKHGKAKGKAAERFAVLNSFVDFTLADLARAEIAVWLILYRDTREGTARTAVSDLARRAGCDRTTVFRALRRLETRGLVKVVHRGGLGKGASRYRVRPFLKEIP